MDLRLWFDRYAVRVIVHLAYFSDRIFYVQPSQAYAGGPNYRGGLHIPRNIGLGTVRECHILQLNEPTTCRCFFVKNKREIIENSMGSGRDINA